MKTRALHLAAAVLLGSSLASWLGCGRDSAIEIKRDNKDNGHVQINDTKIRDSFHKAGQEMSKDAHNLGNAVQQGARDLDQRVGPAARETLADAALTTRVKARLIAAPDLGGIRIHVSSRDGQVTLDGTVASADNVLDAVKITHHTEGVREVINHLQVGPTG
ncbi:MAG TPA: BON domain-containing protein [Thermoanaerobaculia bacterium]|nr:BON domain-containing protein [Thermoanaerobaculia bacterium]